MKSYINRFASLVGAALFLALTASAASAIDLQGTWEGTMNCKGIDASGAFVKAKIADNLALAQSGDAIDFNGLQLGRTYVGSVIERDGKPDQGQAAFHRCSPAGEETGHFQKIKVKNPPDAKMKGIVISETPAFLGGINFEYYTCKLNYTRIDTADPGIFPCP